MQFRLEALGKQIGELIGSRHPVETKMPELCSLMRKVLPDVGVHRSFSATTHIVGPLDTRSVVYHYTEMLPVMDRRLWLVHQCASESQYPSSPVAFRVRRTLLVIQLEARMFLEVLLQATLHDGVLPYVMVLPMHKNAPTAQQYKRCQI